MHKTSLPGERLRDVRTAARLRLEDVAGLLGVGIATLHGWERGDLPKVRYHAILRAIGKAYRARDEAYRVANKTAREVTA